jgi:SAM-dependent methyltransferase
VVATDWSQVAIDYQRGLAERFAEETPAGAPGSFVVEEGDFTRDHPTGPFDAVINCRAFQGLSFDAMRAAAAQFHHALRPGGIAIFETVNVGSPDHRTRMEESLSEAGFYLPFVESDRWYRRELARIHATSQEPRGMEDNETRDSLRAEFERRRKLEVPEVENRINDPATIVATILYGSG